jgi:hypothetical protein
MRSSPGLHASVASLASSSLTRVEHMIEKSCVALDACRAYWGSTSPAQLQPWLARVGSLTRVVTAAFRLAVRRTAALRERRAPLRVAIVVKVDCNVTFLVAWTFLFAARVRGAARITPPRSDMLRAGGTVRLWECRARSEAALVFVEIPSGGHVPIIFGSRVGTGRAFICGASSTGVPPALAPAARLAALVFVEIPSAGVVPIPFGSRGGTGRAFICGARIL